MKFASNTLLFCLVASKLNVVNLLNSDIIIKSVLSGTLFSISVPFVAQSLSATLVARLVISILPISMVSVSGATLVARVVILGILNSVLLPFVLRTIVINKSVILGILSIIFVIFVI